MIGYKSIKSIYSFDNGRGNVSCCKALDNESPVHITERGGELAGFAETQKGNFIIGADLSAVDYDTFRECRVSLDLKKRPTEENLDELVKYFTAWRKKLMKCSDILADKAFSDSACGEENDVWFIGCPSAWSNDDIKLYIEIFRKAGFPNPIVIPESVAAVKYCKKSAKISESALIVIDFGAYSNDCSGIRKDKSFSVGSYLGAHIIEEMIICANLFRNNDYARDPSRLNSSLIEQVAEQFRSNENLRQFLILQGRQLKEKYFKESSSGSLGSKDVILPVTLEKGRILNLFVNVRMMNDLIYDLPIKEILTQQVFEALPSEVRKEIGDKKYINCFSDFLDNIALKGEEVITHDDTAIILTGGAAAMDFVLPLVAEKFKGCAIKTGSNPVEAVAEGLVLLSQEKLLFMRTARVLATISDEESEGHKKIDELVADAAGSFYETIYEAVISAYKTVFDTNIIFWRKHVYSCSEIYQEMEKDIEKRFREELIDKFPEYFNNSCTKLEEFLNNLDDGILLKETEKKVFFDPQLTKEVAEDFAKDTEILETFRSVYALITAPARMTVDQLKENKVFKYFFRQDCENSLIKDVHPHIQKALAEVFSEEIIQLIKNMFELVAGNIIIKSAESLKEVFPHISVFREDDYNTTQIS